MSDLKQVFIHRDQMSIGEADRLIEEMRERVMQGENPEDLLYEVGLEPDYIFDLL